MTESLVDSVNVTDELYGTAYVDELLLMSWPMQQGEDQIAGC